MARYEVNGQRYELSDDITDDEALKLIYQDQGINQEQSPSPTAQSDTSVKPEVGQTSETTAAPQPEPSADRATQRYVIRGQEYVLSADMPQDEALALIYQHQGLNADGSPAASQGNSIDPDTLVHNQDWLHASKTLWQMNNAEPFNGSTKDLADYGLDQLGWFNYNMPRMAIDTARISQASPEQKQAFLYLMSTYDALELSWGGALRFGKGVALDPTTYVGLSTLGIGTAGSSSAKLMSKAALRAMLKAGVVTGIEGAALNAAANSMQQQVRIEAGEREGFNLAEAGGAAALGFGAGAVLGGAVEAARPAFRGASSFLKGSEKPVDGVPAPRAGDVPESPGTVLSDSPIASGESPTVPARVEPGQTPEIPSAKPVADALPAGSAPEATPTAEPHISASSEAVPRAARLADQAAELSVKAEPEVNPILKAVEEYAFNDGLRVFPRTMADRNEYAEAAIREIEKLTPENVAQLTEAVRRADVTGEELSLLKHAFAQANEKMHREVLSLRAEQKATDDAARKVELSSQLAQVVELQKAIRSVDLAESSLTGLDLGSRRGLLDTGTFRDVSPEAILVEQGVNPKLATPEQVQAATDVYLDRLAKRVEAIETHEEVVKLEGQMQRTNDNSEVLRLAKERDVLKSRLAELDPETKGAWEQSSRVLKYLNEYLISTVFTTKTLLVNVIPSAAKLVYRPGLDFLVKGADAKAFREMTATYSAFATNLDVALKAAQVAFRVERGLLNGVSTDVNKVLEEQVMFGGAAGRYLRFFPRVLGATDELFGQLNYRAFVASRATGEAYEAATNKGLTGVEREVFIKRHVAKSVEQSFAQQVDKPSVIDFLRQTGSHNYGLSGAKLDAFIKRELDNNAELYRKATSEAGRDFANDLAFKREFSGQGVASETAKAYEKFVNDNPWMRLVGQLFFRTPVRVFEEGFRLTPGLNLITPHFLRDLQGRGAGGKGGYAQVRAQGEALLSYAIGMGVMSLYAQGKITGGGPQDWRQRRDVEGQAKWDAYTIRFSDGSTLGFKNLDPFSTPLKIVANALDAYSLLQVRKAQGEYVGQAEQYALAHVSAGAFGIVQALKDANLTEGVSQLTDLLADLADPGERSEQLVKWLGKKAQLAVPNQFSKAQQGMGETVLSDPQTIEQYIRVRLDPSDPKVPRRYDALGNVDTMSNPMSALTGVDYRTVRQNQEDRAKVDPKTAYVKDVLAELAIKADTTFQAPFSAKQFAGLPITEGNDEDLRQVRTADGAESYYDRLQRYVRYSDLPEQLYSVFKTYKDHIPQTGTPSVTDEGTLVHTAKTIISAYRKAAYARLASEETEIYANYAKALQDKASVLGGKGNVQASPFR